MHWLPGRAQSYIYLIIIKHTYNLFLLIFKYFFLLLRLNIKCVRLTIFNAMMTHRLLIWRRNARSKKRKKKKRRATNLEKNNYTYRLNKLIWNNNKIRMHICNNQVVYFNSRLLFCNSHIGTKMNERMKERKREVNSLQPFGAISI